MIWELDGIAPRIAPDAFIAPDAQIIGNVEIGAGASVWFGAVIRGDNEPIVIGARSNIQELSCLHTDPGCPIVIGQEVTIGHRVMLHGCRIGDGALIGMGAQILNRAVIGAEALVGAHSLVAEGKEVAEGMLVTGAPARPVRELNAEARAGLRRSAAHYVANAARFRAGLRPLPDLAAQAAGEMGVRDT